MLVHVTNWKQLKQEVGFKNLKGVLTLHTGYHHMLVLAEDNLLMPVPLYSSSTLGLNQDQIVLIIELALIFR